MKEEIITSNFQVSFNLDIRAKYPLLNTLETGGSFMPGLELNQVVTPQNYGLLPRKEKKLWLEQIASFRRLIVKQSRQIDCRPHWKARPKGYKKLGK